MGEGLGVLVGTISGSESEVFVVPAGLGKLHAVKAHNKRTRANNFLLIIHLHEENRYVNVLLSYSSFSFLSVENLPPAQSKLRNFPG
jgi:hypothetical protein